MSTNSHGEVLTAVPVHMTLCGSLQNRLSQNKIIRWVLTRYHQDPHIKEKFEHRHNIRGGHMETDTQQQRPKAD